MATTIEMIEKMQADAEKARAAAKDGGKAFVGNSIVLLAEGQRALVRPIFNMDEAIVTPMHDKYKNTDTSLSSRKDPLGGYVAAPISSICAAHIGKPCLFCAQPKEAKLEARYECFVPVYLYQIQQEVHSGEWVGVTYTDPDNNEKPVKGFRMLRLKQGSAILSQLMATYKDADYSNDITCCNFVIERRGSGLDTKYICTPKPPRPMDPNMKSAIPPREKFVEILQEIYEPRVLERPIVQQATPASASTEKQSSSTPAPTSSEEEFTF